MKNILKKCGLKLTQEIPEQGNVIWVDQDLWGEQSCGTLNWNQKEIEISYSNPNTQKNYRFKIGQNLNEESNLVIKQFTKDITGYVPKISWAVLSNEPPLIKNKSKMKMKQ